MKKNITNKNKILFSIVLCTYNREKHIKQCLESLLSLDFPKNNYEIIVVDDGSTDSTKEIVKKYPVRLLEHKKNQGIAAARNTGLKTAKGKIYICFDDDCYTNKDWLKNLAKAYEKYDLKDISGIAGFIKLTGKENGVIDKYMDETGYANPSPTYYIQSTNIFMRFYSYLKNMFSPSIQSKKKIFEVGEIWGANCSFPINVLKAVNGWDENLSGVEDTDLCDRIKKRFKKRKFICTKNAIIYHDHQLSLKSFLNKPYSRGTAILNFYRKNAKTPPIFPFPLVIVMITLLAILRNPLYGFIALLLLPQIFYAWWGIKALKKKKLYYLIFPYLQSSYELSTILGLMKGYLSAL